MILRDTNVISELLRLDGEAAVLAWIDAQSIDTLYLSVISLAGLRSGIAALSAGKRRDTLDNSLEQRILPLFAGRILPFDAPAPHAYARLLAKARAEGKAIAPADGYIAGIASFHDLIGAVRGTSPFEAAGFKAINPWTAPR